MTVQAYPAAARNTRNANAVRQARFRSRLCGDALERYRAAGRRRAQALRAPVTRAHPSEALRAPTPTVPLRFKDLSLQTTTDKRSKTFRAEVTLHPLVEAIAQRRLEFHQTEAAAGRREPIWYPQAWLKKVRHQVAEEYAKQLKLDFEGDPEAAAELLEPLGKIYRARFTRQPEESLGRIPAPLPEHFWVEDEFGFAVRGTA